MEAAQLPLAILIVFLSAKLMAEICERLGMPGIVGEIVAGVLIGPQALHWVSWDAVLQGAAELGVMFLMFRVGMEIRPSEFSGLGRTSLLVAVGGVVLPFFGGWALLELWGEPRIEAIFAGGTMVATSVGITAQVLNAGGWLRERASKVILAAAVIDDVIGLLVLAVVSSLSKGGIRVWDLALTAAIAIAFTLLVARYGTRAINHSMSGVISRLRVGEAQFAAAVSLLFALSVAAVYAGVATIVGAFLAGLALSEAASVRLRTLVEGVTELLVPFFLVGIGVRFNITSLTHPATLLLAVLLLLVAIVTKAGGAALGSWGESRSNMLRIGAGMIPRGEVGMVAAQLGLSLGVILQGTYDALVFMAVGSTIVAPPLLKLVYRDLPSRPADPEHFTVS